MTVENPILGAAILFLVWFGPSLIVVWIAITAIDKIKEHLGRDTKKMSFLLAVLMYIIMIGAGPFIYDFFNLPLMRHER